MNTSAGYCDEDNTFRKGLNYICEEKKEMEVSSDSSVGIEGGFRPRRFRRRAQRELAVLAIRNQLSELDYWDLPGQERSFEAGRQRHDLLSKVDDLRTIEDIEETEHGEFEAALKKVFH